MAVASRSSARRAARRRQLRIRRAVAAGALLLLVAVGVVAWRATHGGAPGPEPVDPTDVLAFREARASDYAARAARGARHALFVSSPGGVEATAARVARLRPLVDDAVRGSGVRAEDLEALVLLESGGRPDARAGEDLAVAVGLTQILAGTATDFLGMHVDLAASRRLDAALRQARSRGDAAAVRTLLARRPAVDERFDPRRALAGAVRYLRTARRLTGRDDLAVESYHMGIGNLERALRAYAGDERTPLPRLVADRRLSYARLYFDSSPARHARADAVLRSLDDDSRNYLWKVRAAEEIMRQYRHDRDGLRGLAALQGAKASAEEVLHPAGRTRRFADPAALGRARADGTLVGLPDDPDRLGYRVDGGMGVLAARLGRPPSLYRALRPEALALLRYLADRVRRMSRDRTPLVVTSTVRDDAYQRLLIEGNDQATRGYSLHTTGFAFDLLRRYGSRRQAVALEATLERLQALDLVAWVREPAALHVTVASDAGRLLGR